MARRFQPPSRPTACVTSITRGYTVFFPGLPIPSSNFTLSPPRSLETGVNWRHSALKVLDMSSLIITSGSERSESSAASMAERIWAQWEAPFWRPAVWKKLSYVDPQSLRGGVKGQYHDISHLFGPGTPVLVPDISGATGHIQVFI